MGRSTISMAMFNSYVKLPDDSDDTQLMDSTGSFSDSVSPSERVWKRDDRSPLGTGRRATKKASLDQLQLHMFKANEAEPVIKYRQGSSSIVKSHPIQLIKIHQLMVHPILHNQCDPIQHQNSSTVRHPQLMSTVSTWASRGDPSQSAGVPGVLSVRGKEL